MNYSDYSDFEINKRVAELQPYTTVVGEGKYPSASEDAVHVEQRAFKYGNINELGVDYCNNPSDAWPIIVSNSISIVKSPDGLWGASDSYRKILFWGREPLRAAMIVYIMMQEGE